MASREMEIDHEIWLTLNEELELREPKTNEPMAEPSRLPELEFPSPPKRSLSDQVAA